MVRAFVSFRSLPRFLFDDVWCCELAGILGENYNDDISPAVVEVDDCIQLISSGTLSGTFPSG